MTFFHAYLTRFLFFKTPWLQEQRETKLEKTLLTKINVRLFPNILDAKKCVISSLKGLVATESETHSLNVLVAKMGVRLFLNVLVAKIIVRLFFERFGRKNERETFFETLWSQK